ncbi:hypothetical protein CspeluHIS016_0204320 [Cutaneotrichosporon spelunceum]|uniref:Uncharacterized protein n=1 Tax=Cutaneotrichosporon spelunceum TaxID=1672016 RepID=A0AAD3TR08_9TREE|nr:hypothetical protein CspeluHIS016_0204320 [Cutaneotrichosporon spelunceum]
MLAHSHPQYAPHPGELSGETWPMSMADMTEELLRTGTRNRHNSLIHSSAYDNRAEAAAGAAALVGATHVGASPLAATAAPAPTPMVQPLERAAPAPAMASSPLTLNTPVHPSRQFSSGQRQSHIPPPIRLPASPFLVDDYVLPSVVLTPPPDDADAPITLYPRTSPTPDDYPQRGMSMPVHLANASALSQPRSASLPTVPNDAVPPPVQQRRALAGASSQSQAQAGVTPMVSFQKPTPPFGRKHRSSVAAVVMPKKPEQVINDLERKSGARFDAEWNELVEEPRSPARVQANGRINGPAGDSPLPIPTRPAPQPPLQAFDEEQRPQPPPKQQQQQQRSGAVPRGVSEPMRPETPQTPKSPKLSKEKGPATSTEATSKTKGHRRRSLSLSALFSRKKKPNFDDLPSMPEAPQTPKTATPPATSRLPDTPKSTTSEKRKTLLKRTSIKDIFSSSKSAELKALRKSQSKPELHAGNRLVTRDAPPVPALPSMPSSSASQEHKQVVPDALAALTANSNAKPGEPAVEMVPDVFAAFNSSQTSLQQRGVSAQLKGISVPANPPRAESPFANFEHSTEFAASQQRMRQTNGSQASLTARGLGAQRVASPLAQPPDKPTEKDVQTKGPERRRTLTNRLSLSALFSKRKKDAEPVPDVPALPSSFQRTAVAQQTYARQQVPPQPNGLPKSASTQDLSTVRASSPMMKSINETSRPISAKPPPRTPTTARVPVPRLKNCAEAPDTEKLVPTPSTEPEAPSSTVKKYPDPSISKQASVPPAIAAAAVKFRGETVPVAVAPPFLDSAKTEDDVKRQSRREQSVVPPSSAEYLRQQKDAIASHQQAQQVLVQQFRSASEPIAAGPPRSASEQSFQRAANPFAEQAPSAEVIQQAAALVRKPAPMQVVQKAEAEYINQRKDKEHADKVEKLDEMPIPASWTTFDSEPKPRTTLPLKITKKSSLSAGSKDKDAAPLRIIKEQPAHMPVAAALTGAAATDVAATVAIETTKTGSPGKPSSPEYKENPSFSFPPKPKDAARTLFQPAQKIRRVSVPPLHPESLNSPHSAIPVPVPEAGGPFKDPAPVQSPVDTDLAAANAKLMAEPVATPVINIITATPARSPAPSHEGGQSIDATGQREADAVSPAPSEASPAVVTTAVRMPIIQTTPPVLTSAANVAQDNEVDEEAKPGSPSDSEFTLPTLESHSSLMSEQATPTEESFGGNATPTKSSGMPTMLVAGALALAAGATATVSSVSSKTKPKTAEPEETEELIEPRKPKEFKEPGSDYDAATNEHGLAYLDGSSVDTHESVQTPSVQSGFLSLRPVTDEDVLTMGATPEEAAATPVAETKEILVANVEHDEATSMTTTKETHLAERREALVGEPVDVDGDDDRDTQSAPLEEGPPPRCESVPPSSPTVQPVGHLMSSLPTRLGVSPVAEGVQARRAPRSLIYAMAASAASAVSLAVSSAFAEASETLDELDEQIEKTVKSASPNLGSGAALPAGGTTPAHIVSATVVKTGHESRQGSVFSGRRRGSSSDDGASIYTTPMTDMDSEYFDSPSASTTSFETASSNATVSPEAFASLPSYSNSARPPSVAVFDDVQQPAFARSTGQRRGSMPVALAASAARKRNVSSPVLGSGSTEFSVAVPCALGITYQDQQLATMPVSSIELPDLTPSPLPASADGHSEESSTFHLDTDTIMDSPTEDFAALPDSPTSERRPRSRMRDASSMYVVPFSPEMEDQEGRSETRTQTSSNYVPASGVLEHVRRASGGVRNVFAASGFGRSDRDDVAQRSVASGQVNPVVPETRNSVAVDYSAPAGTNPASAASVGLGMWTADEIEELGPFRRLTEVDASFEESWSSGSDDHESVRTPRTPELDALVTTGALPAPGTPSPADKVPKRTGAPFRPLHVDMAAEA